MEREFEMNPTEKSLVDLYRGLQFESDPVCRKCRACSPALGRPVGAWVVGDKFYRHTERVLFVGKTARGEPGEDCGGFLAGFRDARERLWSRPWPYWSYTREIVRKLYGDDSMEHIAFTNLVKCNASNGGDLTAEETKRFCVCERNVIGKEIALIEPTHVVFYTSWNYDQVIPKIFDRFQVTVDTKRSIGEKRMPWREARAETGGREICVLRIGHPERMKRESFTDAVCGWVRTADGALEGR